MVFAKGSGRIPTGIIGRSLKKSVEQILEESVMKSMKKLLRKSGMELLGEMSEGISGKLSKIDKELLKESFGDFLKKM